MQKVKITKSNKSISIIIDGSLKLILDYHATVSNLAVALKAIKEATNEGY